MRRFVAAAVALAALAGACNDLAKAWLIDRTRVVGVRVESASDPTRASLAPSERGRATWLVVSPDATPRLAWAFAICAPPVGTFADPKCETPVLVSGSGSGAGETVVIDFEVPPLEALGDARELLLLAAFCESAPSTLDAATFDASCEDGAPPRLASARLRVDAGAPAPNHNPPLSDDALRLGDAVLPPSTATVAGAPCAPSPDAPRVSAGGPALVFGYRFRDEDREATTNGRESLVLASLVTAGALERTYSAFDPEEPGPGKDVTFTWTPPSRDAVGARGRLVRFFFVLRDDRGGQSFARRAVCVVAE